MSRIVFVIQSKQKIRICWRPFLQIPIAQFILISSTQLETQSLENHSFFLHCLFLESMDFDSVLAAAQRYLSADAISPLFITNDEYCLTLVSALNGHYQNKSHPLPTLSLYVDKVAMKQKLQHAGIRTPQYVSLPAIHTLSDAQLIDCVSAQLKFPMIGKPTQEANNRGVAILNSVDELLVWASSHKEKDVEVEEFISGTLYHCNSMIIDGIIQVVAVGEYLNPCLAFSHGKAIGSIFLPIEHPLYQQICIFNAQVINQLGQLQHCVFHLELFRKDNGELVFLEIAARAPGGMLSKAVAYSTGINLEEVNFKLQINPEDKKNITPTEKQGAYSCWCWVPKQAGLVTELITFPIRSPHECEWYVKQGENITQSEAENAPACGIIAWSDNYDALYRDFCQLKEVFLPVGKSDACHTHASDEEALKITLTL